MRSEYVGEKIMAKPLIRVRAGGNPRDWSDNSINTLRRLRNKGYTLAEISAALNRSKRSISWFIHQHGSHFGISSQEKASIFNLKAFESEWAGCLPKDHWAFKSWKTIRPSTIEEA